jgi:hypothetical protein
MMLFDLITHLEMCIRALVRERAPWPKWVEALKKARRRELRKNMATLKSARFEPDALEFSNFSDVSRDCSGLETYLGRNVSIRCIGTSCRRLK